MNINDPQSKKDTITPSTNGKGNSNFQNEEKSEPVFERKIKGDGGENDYKERLNDKLKLNKIYDWAGSNKEQTICYVLLAIGFLVFLLLDMFVGGLILGVLAGYYFSTEIMDYFRSLSQIGGGPQQLSTIILTVVIICLIIAAPGIFIGAAIAAAFKQAVSSSPR